MLKKIDGINAQRYMAFREMAMLHAHDKPMFESVMLLIKEGHSSTTPAEFDAGADEIIAALAEYGVANFME